MPLSNSVRCSTTVVTFGVLGFAALISVTHAGNPQKTNSLPDDNRSFGTIFNNDTNNVLYALDAGKSPKSIISDYRHVMAQIAEAHPGIMAQNVGNPDPVIYRSNEATAWSKYIGGDESDVMNKMIEAGTDPFQITIDVCREHGVPVVASYRMNAEDFYEKGLEIQDFGRMHKHLAIPGAFCLDPAHPIVYAHRMAIFREVAEKYDIDGIEFDFRRWAHMISDPLKNHTILTRMVRETRQLLDEIAKRKGKKRLILGVRVGPSIETPQNVANYAGSMSKHRDVDSSCKELGLDVKTWVQDDLVDYICPSLFWPDWPGLPFTREFSDLAKGHNVGIYPTIFPRISWLNDSGDVVNRGPIQPGETDKLQEYKDGFCKLALDSYAEGADGLSMFNWYFHLHLARAPRQWQAYYGYGMGGSAIQKHFLSICGSPRAIRDYRSQLWFWPTEYESLLNDFRPVETSLSVQHTKTLPAQIPAKRVPIGIANDANPSLGVMPNGHVILILLHTYDDAEPGKVQDQQYLCRSTDEGRSWSPRELLPLLGRDPYLTVISDGTLLVTSYLLTNDTGNTTGQSTGYLHRSKDGGKRWSSKRINSAKITDAWPVSETRTSRNILELRDGSLILGVTDAHGGNALWQSRDNGESWIESNTSAVDPSNKPSQTPRFGEAVFWETGDGNLQCLSQSIAKGPVSLLKNGVAPSADLSATSGFGFFRSEDGGLNWQSNRNLALSDVDGERSPSLLRLQDARYLLTFAGKTHPTQSFIYGAVSETTPTGHNVDFPQDRIILSQRMHDGQSFGSGFGSSVQLSDGHVLSGCSYRDAKGTNQVDVVRWKLP